MSTYNNPKLLSRVTPTANGALYIDRQVTDISDPAAFPAALANADLVQIGVVPAGTKLVPHLCRLSLPDLDTGSTGNASVGTAASGASLIAAGSIQAAAVKSQSDFKAVEIGSPTDDTPLYLAATAASTTPATGQIVFDLALRAWDTAIDG